MVVQSPRDRNHPYRVGFTDGFEAVVRHDNLILLAEYKQGSINDADQVLAKHGLFDRVIFRCVIGSRAYGLDDENSDIDRRGIYLPPAQVVREALEQFLNGGRRSSVVTVAELAGDLLGSAQGPRDLATNPKYMEGYGK